MSRSRNWFSALSTAALMLAVGSCDDARVTEPEAVASVEVMPGDTALFVGGTLQLGATVLGSSGGVLADRAVAWTASDSTIAVVSADGLVTAVGAGSAVISATSEGRSSAVSVRAIVRASEGPVASGEDDVETWTVRLNNWWHHALTWNPDLLGGIPGEGDNKVIPADHFTDIAVGIDNSGTITVYGTLLIYTNFVQPVPVEGFLSNTGTLHVMPGGLVRIFIVGNLYNHGTIINEGEIRTDFAGTGGASFFNDGYIENRFGGEIDIGGAGTLRNTGCNPGSSGAHPQCGQIFNQGVILVNDRSKMVNLEGGVVFNQSALLALEGSEIYNNAGANIQNHGVMNTAGFFENLGQIHSACGASIDATGEWVGNSPTFACFQAESDGSWMDGQTWNGGQPPNGTGVVHIMEGVNVTLEEGDVVDLASRIDNNGTLTIDGRFRSTLDFTNRSEVAIGPTGELQIDDRSFRNLSGTLTNAGILTTGEDGSLFIPAGTVNNHGVINNHGGIDNFSGTFNNSVGAHIENFGLLDNREIFNNHGGIENQPGATIRNRTAGTFTHEGPGFVNRGTVENDATWNNRGLFANEGVLENDRTLNNTGVLLNEDMITNWGTISNGGLLEVTMSGVVVNHHAINSTGSGAVRNEGLIHNECGGTVTGTLTGNPLVLLCDQTPPLIAAVVNGDLGSGGWYTSDVSVGWDVSEAESPDNLLIIGGCGAASVTDDTQGRIFECSARSEGGTTDESVTIRRDVTPPVVSAAATTAPNGFGWYNASVTIAASGSDATSGIEACETAALDSDGADQQATVSCRDRAGHSASATVAGIDIDGTAPAVSGASRSPDHDGWYNRPLSVSWTATDALSGIDACADASAYDGPDGGDASVSGECTDRAGNRAIETFGFRYDATAPTIAGTASPAANQYGWNNTAVVVRFACADAVSGVASCSGGATLDGEGTEQSAAGTATDAAGNVASAAVNGIDIDLTAPTVVAAPSRAPDWNGWYNHALSVAWRGSDELSGIDGCEPSTDYARDDASARPTGTCTDLAGNSGSATFALRYDATRPVITFAGNAGVYTTDQAVRIGCDATDLTSGIDAGGTVCLDTDAPAWSFAAGMNTIEASATDVAGNTTSATTSFTVEVSYTGLSNVVEEFVSSRGQAGSLNAKLATMERARNPRAREAQRGAFIHQVEALRGRALTHEQADALIRLVREL